jgi:dipeptidyl aminopeptidase/acylaminoacyl peptidase
MLAAFLAMLLGQAVASQAVAVPDVTRLTVSSPRRVIDIDAGKLGGDPAQLSWGPDQTLYLRMTQSDRWGNERSRPYLVALGAPRPAVAPTGEEPAWASSYWLWKSALLAPGIPRLEIYVETEKQLKTAVGSVRDPRGNPQSRADADLQSLQGVRKTTLKLRGVPIAELTDAPFIPGLTFGWAPAPMGMLAYVDGGKHLMLIDRDGRKREAPGAHDVALPAWSPDGRQIAYLQRMNKSKYLLMIADISGQ